MQAFSYKVRDCAATDLQNRLLCARAYDRTRTHAAFHTHQRLPAELLVHAPRAGRPLGAAAADAEKAAQKALLDAAFDAAPVTACAVVGASPSFKLEPDPSLHDAHGCLRNFVH